jgi:ribonuclease D
VRTLTDGPVRSGFLASGPGSVSGVDVDRASGEAGPVPPPAAESTDAATSGSRRRTRRRSSRRPRLREVSDAVPSSAEPASPRAEPAREASARSDGAGASPGLPDDGASPTPDAVEEPALPPLLLRDGLPPLVETLDALAATISSLGQGSGPLAIDTERASGYRYGQRAYLVQIRRAGSRTHLIDPIAVPGVPGLAEALAGPEWILHAATQDLPCLQELDLRPSALFDTELAGRLLGMPRVGLAPMVAELLGHSLAKGHGAADWSRRPLPADWLEYAALDVEVLLELREELVLRLEAAGKLEWALEEFEAIRTAAPAEPRTDPWRRTAGIHQVRSRRGLAIIHNLWIARDGIARETDIAPGRLLPDSSIVAAAKALPRDVTALRSLRTFHGRGVVRHQREWGRALEAAWAIPEAELPKSAPRGEGVPPARIWRQRDPEAAARLDRARTALGHRAEQLQLPVENLLTPELVRRLVWDPVTATAGDLTTSGVADYLRARGARRWQVEQVSELLARAIPVPS